MSRRIEKILSLVNKSKPGVSSNPLFLPKYESTKGTTAEERQKAIEGFSLLVKDKKANDVRDGDTTSEEKTSGSEYIQPSNESLSDRTTSDGNVLKKRKKKQRKNKNKKTMKNKIKILQDIKVKTNKNNAKNYLTEVKVNTQAEIEGKDECVENTIKVNKSNVNYNLIESNVNTNTIQQNTNEGDGQCKQFLIDKYLDSYASKPFIDSNNSKIENESFKNQETENLNLSVADQKRFSEETVDSVKLFRQETSVNDIQIVAASKKNGKRKRDKIHICLFCDKPVIHMARHFATVHKETADVAKYLMYPKNSRERRDGFQELIRVGDFYHNCNVLSTRKGELILIRRPAKNEVNFVKYSDYGPCPNCLGFLLKKHLWHHIKFSCKQKGHAEEFPQSKHVIAESDAMISDIYGLGFPKDFYDTIVNKMLVDEIGNVTRSDLLILKFGFMQYEKHGKTQNDLIRQTMRQLGRLTIELRKITNNNSSSLSEFLVPEKFDIVIEATKNISIIKMDDETSRPEFKIPSLAIKISYALQKCISIERGTALRTGNVKKNKSLTSFFELMKMEWNNRISSNAISTLYKRKMNCAQLLPLTNDLVKLNNYIDSNIESLKKAFEVKRTNKDWTRLATLVLSRIILFNKRRSGEAAKMKLIDYINRPLWENQNTQETKESLSAVERKLAENLTIVEIIGKRNRKVPVILTPLVKESIDVLIRHRYECGISAKNKHIFARSGDCFSNLRGYDCLKKICSEITLQNPELITGTKLRKYIATVCQLVNMSENEYDWLARHLGHDIKVHREFYRLHESAVELTKVSRLLIAADKGEINQFAGKKLEEIAIEDLPYLEEEEGTNDEFGIKKGIEKEREIDQEEEGTEEEKGAEGKERKINKTREIALVQKIKKEKVYWTPEEKTAVFNFFRIHIKKKIVPKQKECLECILQNPADLNRRNWKDIKNCVHNEIKSQKNRLKNITVKNNK